MKRFFRSKLALSIFAVVLLAGAIAVPMVGSITRSHAAAPVAATTPTVSGQGIAAHVNALGIINVTACDTGTLSPTGTPPSTDPCSVASLTIPTLGSLGALTANTSGQITPTIGATTNAQVLATALTLLGIPATADILSSTASANCVNGRPVLSGQSTFANLVLGTNPAINGNVTPNTTIDVPVPLLGNVHAILNEQTTTPGSITVNALHLIVTGPLGVTVADITLASSHADVHCGPPPCKEPKNSDKIEHVQDGPSDPIQPGECED
jgi:hypothetical protein